MNVAIDAQRGEFFLAVYEISADGAKEVGPLRIVPAATVDARAAAGEMLAGPEATRWLTAGKILLPSAMALAKLAARRNDFSPGEKLEPVYLRETNFVKAPPARLAG